MTPLTKGLLYLIYLNLSNCLKPYSTFWLELLTIGSKRIFIGHLVKPSRFTNEETKILRGRLESRHSKSSFHTLFQNPVVFDVVKCFSHSYTE